MKSSFSRYFAMIIFFNVTLICGISLTVFSQNVGIGTTIPGEKLHVAGNIKADTIKPNTIKYSPNAGSGKVLTSDINGNASWQDLRSANGGVGYGTWGDCSMTNISEYHPVADTGAAANDLFGHSVSISGNYAIVGTPYDDVGANTNQGSASIYQLNEGAWTLVQKITDATGVTDDEFGISVSISGNYAIIGAHGDDIAFANQGSASIYQRIGSTWTLMQKITNANPLAIDLFGNSVCISGNYAVVGARVDDELFVDQGSACVYQFNGSAWVLMGTKITDFTGSAFANFGFSVSISGNYVIVGSPYDDAAFADQGSVSIYQWNGTNWVLMGTKFTAVGGAATNLFGYSVSISGNYAIVGAPLENYGSNMDQGAAYIYQRNGSAWSLMLEISEHGSGGSEEFGHSVFISGNFVIVGAHTDDKLFSSQGSTTIYQRMGLGWTKLQYIFDPVGNTNDKFGFSVSIDETTRRFIVAAYGYANSSGKTVFGKIN